MSLKSFLKMQEGGQTFVSPFAQPDPTGTTKAVTPRQRPNLTFETVTGIKREETPTTITIPAFGEPDRITPIREKKPENFDPGVSNISSFGYTAQSPEVTAAATAMGIQLTGFEDGAFYDSLVAMNRPETPLSRAFDNVLGPLLPFTPKGTLGLSLAAFPPGKVALSVQRALSGEPIFGTSKADTPATPATPTTTSKAATPATTPIATKVTTAPVGYTYPGGGFGATVTPAAPAPVGYTYPGGGFGATVTPAAPAPVGYTYPGGGFGATVTPAAPAPAAPAATPASVGADIFGPAYGQGGEISPDFAIGGKGSFTSFSHYSAGVSQADEANIISTGINNGVFADSQSGRDTIDAMVEGGHSENVITAVATGKTNTAEITALAEATGAGNAGVGGDGGGGGDGPSVICQELYDQGLLEHSIYSLDEQFGEYLRKHDLALLEGYHAWAYNVVNAMRKSKTITHIVRIVSRPVVKHIAYKMGHPSKTLLGAAMFNVGAFICRRLAKKEIVYA